jgi:hypothetical protein
LSEFFNETHDNLLFKPRKNKKLWRMTYVKECKGALNQQYDFDCFALISLTNKEERSRHGMGGYIISANLCERSILTVKTKETRANPYFHQGSIENRSMVSQSG